MNNDNVINILKNKNKNLKIVVGAGNVDSKGVEFEGLDYTNFKNYYDSGITEYNGMIDPIKKDFLALKLNIDDNDNTKYMAKQLENLCSIVIFDFDVIKFFGNNNGIYMLIDLLLPNSGYLYINDPKSNVKPHIDDIKVANKIQYNFNNNYGKLFMIKYEVKSENNDIIRIFEYINNKIDENNKLYFKNKFENSEYNIVFEIITGVYPLHKGTTDGFPNTTFYKIKKIYKNKTITNLLDEINILYNRKNNINGLLNLL